MSNLEHIETGYAHFTISESARKSLPERPKLILFPPPPNIENNDHLLPNQISELVQKLKELENVEDVRYIFSIPDDIHSLIFQIKITHTNEDDLDEDDSLYEDESLYYEENLDTEFKSHPIDNLYRTAQSLVLETCKELRDTTHEKWYFLTQLVTQFDDKSLDF